MVEHELSARGSSSHGEDGRHATALKGERRVTNGVNATVNTVQSPRKNPRPNRIVAHTEIPHLSDRDHSMLILRQSGDQRIGWAYFPVHFTDK